MKFMKIYLTFIILLLVSVRIYGGADALLIDPDAFSSSRGNVSTILDSNNIWSVYNNQGNLFLVRNRGIGISYQIISDEFNLISADYVEPINNVGSIGIGLSYLDYGTLSLNTGIDMDGNSISSDVYSARDILVVGGFGGIFGSGVMYGIGLKIYINEIANSKENIVVGDINILKNFENKISIGLSGKNIGASDTFPIPFYIAVGVEYPLIYSKSKNMEFSVFSEIKYFIEKKYSVDEFNGTLGLQYKIGRVSFNLSANIMNNKEPFNFGGGGMSYYLDKPFKLRADYALNIINREFGGIHTLSISYLLDRGLEKEKTDILKKPILKENAPKKEKKEDDNKKILNREDSAQQNKVSDIKEKRKSEKVKEEKKEKANEDDEWED